MGVKLSNRELAKLTGLVDRFRACRWEDAAKRAAGTAGLPVGVLEEAFARMDALERNIKDPRQRLEEKDLADTADAGTAARAIEAAYKERFECYCSYIAKACGVLPDTAMRAAEEIGLEKRDWEFQIRTMAKQEGLSQEDVICHFLAGPARKTGIPLADMDLIYRALRESSESYVPFTADDLYSFTEAVFKDPDRFHSVTAEEAAGFLDYEPEAVSQALPVIFRRESKRRTMMKIMKDYHSGDPERRSDSTKCIFYELEGFIWDQVKSKASTWKGDELIQDIVSECKAELLKDMERYDPNQTLPTSFFAKSFQHAITGMGDSLVFKETAHFSKLAKKVSNGIARAEQLGIPADINTLSIITDLPMEQVSSGMAIINGCKEKHYDDPAEIDAECSRREKSTEQKVIENERSGAIRNALSKLSDTDRDIFLSFVEGSSFTEIGKKHSMPVHAVSLRFAKARTCLQRDSDLYNIYHDTKPKKPRPRKTDSASGAGVRLYPIGDIMELYGGFE